MVGVVYSKRRKYRFKNRCTQGRWCEDTWDILPANQRPSVAKRKDAWNRFSLTASRRSPEDACLIWTSKLEARIFKPHLLQLVFKCLILQLRCLSHPLYNTTVAISRNNCGCQIKSIIKAIDYICTTLHHHGIKWLLNLFLFSFVGQYFLKLSQILCMYST